MHLFKSWYIRCTIYGYTPESCTSHACIQYPNLAPPACVDAHSQTYTPTNIRPSMGPPFVSLHTLYPPFASLHTPCLYVGAIGRVNAETHVMPVITCVCLYVGMYIGVCIVHISVYMCQRLGQGRGIDRAPPPCCSWGGGGAMERPTLVLAAATGQDRSRRLRYCRRRAERPAQVGARPGPAPGPD